MKDQDTTETKINEAIRVYNIRLIDENSTAQGIVKTKDALVMAKEKKLDLVMVSEESDPPVCKIMNFGKVKYQKNKTEKKQKQNQTEQKEIWLRPNTEDHDLETKMKQASKFLGKGHKVLITIKFKGRELRLNQGSDDIVDKVRLRLEEVAEKFEVTSLEGRQRRITIEPKK